jgi:ABC-type nickel/cobalt efflux system permease component RcnA
MGRLRHPVRHGRRQGLVALVAAAVGVVLLPAIAAAHPLGNYTINHYAEVRVEPDRILLDVVIDEAEIPTFQSRQDLDLDADGVVSDEEIDAGRAELCRSLSSAIEVTAGGAAVTLGTLGAGLAFPPGVGGLSTMRTSCAFGAMLSTPIERPTEITFTDRSFSERIGWREIVSSGSGVTLASVEGKLRDASVSKRLTAYPPDLIATPLADARSVLTATPGGPALPPLATPDALPIPGVAPLPARGGDASTPPAAARPAPLSPVATPAAAAVPGGLTAADLPAIFRETDLTPIVFLISLVTAAALGAGHALTPGHGKTLMAAYLVGTRGTVLHAIGLGLSVSVSHTTGILVLAAVVIGLSGAVAPDAVVRGAPIVAAVSIVLIGGWMLVSELRRRRGLPQTHHDDHDHDHDHEQDHVHPHDHEAAHAHDHAAANHHRHARGGIPHSHAPAPGSTITWRSLFLLGLAGGLIPSTSALLILLGSIAAGRPAFGFVLVVAFGLGMAAVMAGIGIALVAARERVEGADLGTGLTRLRETIPLVASVIVFSVGLFLTAQALGGPPTL